MEMKCIESFRPKTKIQQNSKEKKKTTVVVNYFRSFLAYMTLVSSIKLQGFPVFIVMFILKTAGFQMSQMDN